MAHDLLSNALLITCVCVVPLTIFMYVENGRLNQTVCLCQFLPYNKEKSYRNF